MNCEALTATTTLFNEARLEMCQVFARNYANHTLKMGMLGAGCRKKKKRKESKPIRIEWIIKET